MTAHQAAVRELPKPSFHSVAPGEGTSQRSSAFAWHQAEDADTTSIRMGRPRTRTPGLIAGIAAYIRMEGISDSAAGLLAGVSTSTLSRWKQEDEEVAIALGQARALYELERARAIRQMVKRDGTLDWRAQAWLLQSSSPEVYGNPSRRRLARAERRLAEQRQVEQEGREEREEEQGPEQDGNEVNKSHHDPPSDPHPVHVPLGRDGLNDNPAPDATMSVAAVCDRWTQCTPDASLPPRPQSSTPRPPEAHETVTILPESPAAQRGDASSSCHTPDVPAAPREHRVQRSQTAATDSVAPNAGTTCPPLGGEHGRNTEVGRNGLNDNLAPDATLSVAAVCDRWAQCTHNASITPSPQSSTPSPPEAHETVTILPESPAAQSGNAARSCHTPDVPAAPREHRVQRSQTAATNSMAPDAGTTCPPVGGENGRNTRLAAVA